jgi:hypothetical protein
VTGDPVDAIARAVLYEGYVLWPYRRSANKNRQRWTFGGVHPEGWSREHPDDRSVLRTQCLLEGTRDAAVDVSVRFLQVVRRQPVDDGGEAVDELDGRLAWDEARERELSLTLRSEQPARPSRSPLAKTSSGSPAERCCAAGRRSRAPSTRPPKRSARGCTRSA